MITLTLSPYSGPPACGNHISTDWQIATDSTFLNIINESLGDAVNLLSYSHSSNIYYPKLYGRARFNLDNCTSEWAVVTLNNDPEVLNEIDRPSVVIDTATGVANTSSFSFTQNTANPETHTATTWLVKDGNSNIVFSSIEDTANLTSITVPMNSLALGVYGIFAQHIGDSVAPTTSGILSSDFGAAIFEKINI
jgi:hypothetical protein